MGDGLLTDKAERDIERNIKNIYNSVADAKHGAGSRYTSPNP
jgi:hypothetical protein